MSGSADVGCSALLRRRRAAELDRHARALGRAVGQYLDADAVEFLDLAQFAALFVEQIEGRLLARAQDDLAALAARRFLLDQAQRRQARRRCGADEPGALAMWAGAGRCLEHAGAQSLAAQDRKRTRLNSSH